MIATLIVCAILATAITNAVFGRDEQRTQSIAARHPRAYAVFVAVVVAVVIMGVWVNL